MLKRKSLRRKGKLRLSEYFKELKDGDKVAIVKELSVQENIPKRMQGKTGVVEGKRGRAYIVKIRQGSLDKRFIIEPIHLKKIKTS